MSMERNSSVPSRLPVFSPAGTTAGAAVTTSLPIVPVKAGGGLFSASSGKSWVAGATSEESAVLTRLCADINAMRGAAVGLSATDKITVALVVAPTASATDAMRRLRPRLDMTARWAHSGSKLPTDRGGCSALRNAHIR